MHPWCNSLTPKAIELPRDREGASKMSLIDARYAQLSIGSLIGVTAANLQVFGTWKDFGNARRNRSFGAGKFPSDGPEFHKASVLQPQLKPCLAVFVSCESSNKLENSTA